MPMNIPDQRTLEILAMQAGESLLHQKQKIAVAESCTGGWVAQCLTAIAGSSTWFERGFVAYSNEAKQEMLGVSTATLQRHGAVSAETARDMASGAVNRLQCDVAVSTPGIAGPTGGSATKPVGTVYLGLCYQGEVSDHLFHFSGSRRQIQEKTAHAALDLVRRFFLAH